jgi:hypothetical protein
MYLSGKPVADRRIGVMLSFGGGCRQHGHEVWAADNGCYTRPDTYSDDGFLSWIDRHNRAGCLFAVAPDVVADAAATLDRAAPMLPKIRRLGFAAALVGQDGATPDSLPWPDFDALFIGGSTEWKLSGMAADLIAEGKRQGKWVHMGRVNSWARISAANALGVNSVDGTFIAFAPDKNTPQVISWLDRIAKEPTLFIGKTCGGDDLS